MHVSEATYNYLSPIDRRRYVFEENTDMETRKNTTIAKLKTFFVTRKPNPEKDSKWVGDFFQRIKCSEPLFEGRKERT